MTSETDAGRTVGREQELALLDGALDELERGAFACVAIDGEPGIGKTRLLDELRRRAERRHWLVLEGSAAEFERDLPFSVWADALDAYVASRGHDGSLDAELADVLPSLRGAAAGSALADERYRAHRAVRGLLTALAAEQPLVLALDDLHWSDPTSVELLAALLRRRIEAPVLLALAFRSGRADARLAAALAAPGVRRIGLEPLAQDEAAMLLDDCPGEVAAAIYRHGGGNPFYLGELVRASREGRLPELGDADRAGGVPAAVAASLAEEVGALSDEERAFLEGAAVAGEPFEPDLAAAIAELDPAAGLRALDRLLALELVRPTAIPRRFGFRHPLVRRAVYESSPGGWRLAAHARAAAALEARGAAAPERAHHVVQSAAPGDEDAIALLLRAGTVTAPRAPAAGATWFEAALRLLPAHDRERHVEALEALARCRRSLGDLERCRTTLIEALELLPPGDDAHRVELVARCAAVEHWLGRHDDAHERLVREWERLADRSTPAGASLQVELAVDALYQLDFERAIAMGEGGLAAAAEAGDDALHAEAAAALCLIQVCAGSVEAARATRATAVALVERLSDGELAPHLETLYHLGWAENYLEHYADAAAHVERGIALARTAGDGRVLIPMMLVEGYTFEMQGRTAAAIAQCDAAVEMARIAGGRHHLFWALFELAFAHYHAGDLEAAIAAAEESLELGGTMTGATIPAGGGGPGWVLAMSLFEAGEVERAWTTMQALGSDELPHKIPAEKCFDWEILGLVALARGRREEAGGYIVRTERHADALGLQLPRALARRGRAALLLADGATDEAAAAAGEAVELASGIGARLPAAFALALRGQALAAGEDRAAAIAVLREAERELDACGSVRVRDQMRRELRRFGARAEPRGPGAAGDSGVASLSRREREIAELVCDRKTNREIAAELFLSEKTVESHLRSVFVKLGASSRVQVARVVERERREADRDRQPANT